MTIAARIRELHAEGISRNQIAYTVDRSMGYVRAVLSKQRRKEGLRGVRGRPKKKPPPGELASGPEGRRS